MTYTFPDVEKAVQHFIRLELPEATIATRFGSKILDKLPFILVRRTPAQGPTDPRFMDRTIIDVQVLADSREVAYEYAMRCRSALLEAWERQTVTPDGANLSYYTENLAPAEILDTLMNDNVWRYNATYAVIVRTH